PSVGLPSRGGFSGRAQPSLSAARDGGPAEAAEARRPHNGAAPQTRRILFSSMGMRGLRDRRIRILELFSPGEKTISVYHQFLRFGLTKRYPERD
ncbi:unnamed protein product, partial [Nesidiocoris tenuis]